MTLNIASHQARTYTVQTPVFQGPLDLLLHLIERAELDITRLALAQVTDQYLAHLRTVEEHMPDEVSAFLVIAAKLLQIKSEALLPRPPEREPGEEDPGEALARQLRLYKRFKEIANLLAERQKRGWHTYLRLAPPPKVEGRVELEGVTLDDLIAAAQAAFQKARQRPLNDVVHRPRVTIRQKIRHIVHTLRERGRATFRDLIARTRTRLDVVVTFLAMLELIKRHQVVARQQALFGEIELEATSDLNEEMDFDLEFGE